MLITNGIETEIFNQFENLSLCFRIVSSNKHVSFLRSHHRIIILRNKINQRKRKKKPNLVLPDGIEGFDDLKQNHLKHRNKKTNFFSSL